MVCFFKICIYEQNVTFDITCVLMDNDNIYLKYSDIRKYAELKRIYNYNKKYPSFILGQFINSTRLSHLERNMRIIEVSTAIEFLQTRSLMKSRLMERVFIKKEPLTYYPDDYQLYLNKIFIHENFNDDLKSITENLQKLRPRQVEEVNIQQRIEEDKIFETPKQFHNIQSSTINRQREHDFFPISFEIKFSNGKSASYHLVDK